MWEKWYSFIHFQILLVIKGERPMHLNDLKTDHPLSFAKTNSRSGDWNRHPGSQGSSDESGLMEMNGLVVSTMGLTG